jgi:hypothetical protein
MSEPITNDQMEKLLNQQAQTIGGILKNAGSAGPTPTGGGGPSLENFKKADGIMASTIGFIRDLGGGASATAKGLDVLGGVLGKMPGVGQTMQQAFGAAAGTVTDTMGTFKNMSVNGAAFSDGMMGYAKTQAAAGLTNEQMIAQQNKYGQSMSGIAGSQAEAMKTLTNFQNDVRASPIGEKMRGLGLTFEEQNQYINKALAGSQNRDLKDGKAKEDAIAALDKMTTSAFGNAIATGRSTDQIMSQIQANTESLEVQSQLMGGTEETQRAFDRLGPSLAGLGPGLTMIANEAMSTEGVTGPKAAEMVSVLGSAGQDFVRAVQMQKEAAKEGATAQQKAAADAAMLSARAGVDAVMKSENFQTMARQEGRGNAVSENNAFATLAKERTPELRASKATGREMASQMGRDPTELEIVQMQGQVRPQRALTQQTATGEKQVGADLIRGKQEVDARMAAEAIAFPIQQMSKFGKGLDDLGTKMSNMARTGGQVVQPGTIAGGTEVGTPGMRDQAAGKTPPARGNTRDEGTFGILGKHLEPKDAIVKIQKDENVLDKQTSAMLEGLGGIDFIKNMSSGKVPDKMLKDMMGGLDLSKMMPPVTKPTALAAGDIQKQVSGMFNNVKLPIDDKQINSMFSSMKMPTQPDTGQLANMAKSMMPPADVTGTSAKDMLSGLKTQISSVANPEATPVASETPIPVQETTPAPTASTATNEVNSNMLTMLTEISKHMSQLVSISAESAEHASKQVRATEGLSGNRFG